MTKTYFAVLAIGRDAPGIVATITGVLAECHSCNIETSQMTVVGGHFVTTLIASTEAPLNRDELAADLEQPFSDADIRHIYVIPVDPDDYRPFGGREASHVITAQADDRPGVIAEVAKILAENEVNITALSSARSEKEKSLCVMRIAVAPPARMTDLDLSEILSSVAGVTTEIESAQADRRQQT